MCILHYQSLIGELHFHALIDVHYISTTYVWINSLDYVSLDHTMHYSHLQSIVYLWWNHWYGHRINTCASFSNSLKHNHHSKHNKSLILSVYIYYKMLLYKLPLYKVTRTPAVVLCSWRNSMVIWNSGSFWCKDWLCKYKSIQHLYIMSFLIHDDFNLFLIHNVSFNTYTYQIIQYTQIGSFEAFMPTSLSSPEDTNIFTF